MADLGLYANFLEHARLEEALILRRRNASLRLNENAFQMSESEFICNFRLSKTLTMDLISEIEPYAPSKPGAISTTAKVLSALSFYASGSYQRCIGASAHHKMHQVSMSNCLRTVTLALNNDHFRKKYITFPQTNQERNIIKQGFYQKFGMPGVVGCVDGTQIAIVRPTDYEERFFNRKRYHSLNTQIVCDSNLNILSVDASHGGASHDTFIFNSHPLKTHLENLSENENEKLWLLGDSGYAQRATMMTPIINTDRDTPQRHYTNLHCRARNTVERCIGVLKSRWRCLLVDRKLHYHPTMAGYITNACVILHNIANKANLSVPALSPEEERNEAEMQITQNTMGERDSLTTGIIIRNALVDRLWSMR